MDDKKDNDKVKIYHNDDGSIERQVLYDKNGKLKSVTVYEYYDNGRVKSKTLYNKCITEDSGHSDYEREEEVSQDPDYKPKPEDLMKVTRFPYSDRGDSTAQYKYYESGNVRFMTLRKHDEPGRRFEILYYDNGKLKSERVYENPDIKSNTRYYEDGKLKSVTLYEYDGNDLKSKTLYEYYYNGDLKSKTLYEYYYNGDLKSKTLYEYYEDGNLKSETRYNPDGSVK